VRIAVIHSFYSRSGPSGENRVVEEQIAALIDAGHQVRLFGRETDDLRGPLYGIRTGLNVMTSSGYDPSQDIEAFQPDLVHIHNLHPNFGIRWIDKLRMPSVLSIHNYRAFCSNGLLFRDGSICKDCISKGAYSAIQHSCYRDSALATVPMAVSRQSFRSHVLQAVDEVITTSELSEKVVKDLASESIRTTMIPNFVREWGAPSESRDARREWLALGRLSPEKGFLELLDEWPCDEKLSIIGDGPIGAIIQDRARHRGVSVEKSVPLEDMRLRLSQSLGLIFPSRWYEADPQVVAEAMAVGVPVIAYDMNAAANIVEATGSGVAYGSDRTLDQALKRVREEWLTMASAAQDTFQFRWSERSWLSAIEVLYERLALQGGRS